MPVATRKKSATKSTAKKKVVKRTSAPKKTRSRRVLSGLTIGTITIQNIKAHNERAGNQFFSPSTMKFFGSKVLPTVNQGPGGVFFVTSEDNYNRTKKEFKVRQYDPETGDVRSASSDTYSTASDARAVAKELAAGKKGGLKGLAKKRKIYSGPKQYEADYKYVVVRHDHHSGEVEVYQRFKNKEEAKDALPMSDFSEHASFSLMTSAKFKRIKK